MTNRQLVEKEAKELDMEIGCYSAVINQLSKKEMQKVLDNVEWQADTDVKLNRVGYVVQIDHVDNEIDLLMITKQEYINRYGNERYED